jgi:TatD DNase family protein
MTSAWPSLDLHAHVSPDIDAAELLSLRAVIFAPTRSLSEASIALKRDDALTCWGVGAHPKIVSALEGFSVTTFDQLLDRTAYVSEIGLDGSTRARLDIQRAVLRAILGLLRAKPRITSLHSYGATDELIDELERTPIRGAVLHWWRGDAEATARAVDLGAYFSINASSLKDDELMARLPLDRVLPETDHPYGDRGQTNPRPGRTETVEHALAIRNALSHEEIRQQLWRNLAALLADTKCQDLMPTRVAAMVIAASERSS